MLGEGCIQDQADSCRALGALYLGGTGVPQNHTLGLQFIARGCRLGLPPKFKSMCDTLLKRFPQLGREPPTRLTK